MTEYSEATLPVELQGNGSTTVFSPGIYAAAAADLKVLHIDALGVATELTYNTDFSLANLGFDQHFTLTYPISGSPLPSGESLRIYRLTANETIYNVLQYSGFNSVDLNAAFFLVNVLLAERMTQYDYLSVVYDLDLTREARDEAAASAAAAAASAADLAGIGKSVSSFGSDDTALQAAFDWAHTTGGVLIQDNDIDITTNLHHGNLKVRPGGGSWNIVADSNFVVNGGGVFGVGSGAWGDEAAILTRSANGNDIYADALTTQYLVQIEPGVRMTMAHTDNAAPAYPWRLIGLKNGSYVYLDYDATDVTTITNTNTPDFYFYNDCIVGGRYQVAHTDDTAIGGMWIRDLNLGSLGEAYGSSIHLDDIWVRTNGADESIAIFNVAGTNGYLRCTGSLTAINYGNGFGASILNNQDMKTDHFAVALDRMDATAEVKDSQFVVKIINTAAQIGSLRAVLKDLESGATFGGCFRSIVDLSVQALPHIDSLDCVVDGTMAAGNNVVTMAYGDFICDHIKQTVTGGSSTVKYGLSHNLRGVVKSGTIAAAATASVNLSNIEAVTINGNLTNCPSVKGAFISWDTDVWSQAAAITSNASFIYPNDATFHATIYAYGTAAPSKVFSNSDANVVCDVDYKIQRAAAGGAVANADTFAVAPSRYVAHESSGTTVTRHTYGVSDPVSRSGATNITTDGNGEATIAHGGNGTPTGFMCHLLCNTAGREGYDIDVLSLGATTVTVRVHGVAGGDIASSTHTVYWTAFWAIAEVQ